MSNSTIYKIHENERYKGVSGPNYNFIFDKQTGAMHRWGRSVSDDPLYSPVGPEILDIEISINGCPNNCKFCYKENDNSPATNMSLNTFKTVISKIPKCVTQIAFGITGTKSNPEFIDILKYTRQQGIIPNFTMSGIDLDPEDAKEYAKYVGAIAVSAYATNKNICYDAVKLLTDLGMKQINIHLMVSEETLDFVYEVFEDRKNDPRLINMGAIVLLGLKPTGRAKGVYHPLKFDKFTKLFDDLIKTDISFGFDSCSAPKFEKAVSNSTLLSDTQKQQLIQMSDSCESDMFSGYINVRGEWWHCSFTEGQSGYNPINILDISDFFQEVWYSEEVKRFRESLVKTSSEHGCRYCPVYKEINE